MPLYIDCTLDLKMVFSVANFTRSYGEPWARYVRSTVEKFNAGRARISIHYPELVHVLQVGLEVAAARAAVDALSETLKQRLMGFPARDLDDTRNGPVWDALLSRYLMARAEVRRVCGVLVSVMANILDVDRQILLSGRETTSLTSTQRVFFNGARTRLEERTKRLLDQAASGFDAGQRVTASVALSLPAPVTD